MKEIPIWLYILLMSFGSYGLVQFIFLFILKIKEVFDNDK